MRRDGAPGAVRSTDVRRGDGAHYKGRGRVAGSARDQAGESYERRLPHDQAASPAGAPGRAVALWTAANDLPLRDELVPFLMARSGQALDGNFGICSAVDVDDRADDDRIDRRAFSHRAESVKNRNTVERRVWIPRAVHSTAIAEFARSSRR